LVLLTIKRCTFELNILEQLKKILTKISLFILIGIIISACDAEKRVSAEKDFLKNEIIVNDKKTTDEIVFNQL
jgi:hypothetical protein